MRTALALGVVLVGIFAACGGESSRTTDGNGNAGEPSSGSGGDLSTGGGGRGGASSGGAPRGGASTGGRGGAQTGGAPTGGSPTGGSPTGGSGGSSTVCGPVDVRGVGNCDAAFGVFYLGSTCGWVSGCSCEGACAPAYESEEACERAHRGCVTGCTPQDATFVGNCEPLPRKVFTGVGCVEMLGCSCVGDDCDSTYDLEAALPQGDPTPCESAHADCAGWPPSCMELRAVYDEYASRDACQEDSDCRLTFGHCGTGIGGCYYFMNRQWPAEGLDTLAAEFQAANCTGPVCDCAAPPASVRCVDGRCAAGP